MRSADLRRMGLESLHRLRSSTGFSASDAETGLYPALYGRDSLWVLLLLVDALDLRPDGDVAALLAATGPLTLQSLASLQGTRQDDRVEEQPGRIPHEYHSTGGTPHSQEAGLPLSEGRSYGGFDETFLFVLAYDAFVRTHPDSSVAVDLWPNVTRALTWIHDEADEDGDGLFEYTRRGAGNLLNEVWKDSFDSATHTGFDVPPQPLAWLEVQSYAQAVMRTAARWHEDKGDRTTSGAWSSAAAVTAQAVDGLFWLGDEDGYAMAVDGNKRPVRMVASNAGHALWAGTVPDERVKPLVARMTAPDLLSPFGLRTLSAASPFYAPLAYHRGAVWPFDNAIFALGLVRHNYAAEALRVASSVSEAVERAGSAIECYGVLEQELFVELELETAALTWRQWPVRNRVQAFSAAALVVFAAIIDSVG
jgi:glycogen debranching enzyme